jgi:hypothetical protein
MEGIWVIRHQPSDFARSSQSDIKFAELRNDVGYHQFKFEREERKMLKRSRAKPMAPKMNENENDDDDDGQRFTENVQSTTIDY